MIFLRQSTASQEIPLGRFVDSTDGDTEETALTINNTDIKLWKTGATTLASKNSGGATHIANGEYYCVLDATDTDTIGPMRVAVHVAGALAVQAWCCVLDEAVYDVLFGTTAPSTYAGADTSGTTTLLSRIGGAITISGGRVDANVTHLLGTAWLTPGTAGTPDVNAKLWNGLTTVALPLVPTTAGRTLDVSAGGEAGIDWANVGSPTTTVALTGTTIATTQKVDVETIKTQTVTCAAGVTVGAFVGQGTAAIGVNASGHVSRVVLCDTITTYTGDTPQTGDSYAIVNSGTHGNAAIKGYVDDIGAAGAGLTAVPWNAAWDAEVQSEVQDAIEANNLDHLVKIAVDTDWATTVHLNSVVGHLADNGTTATFDRTTDALEAIRDRGDAAWITATGFSTHTAADVWTSGTRTLTAATNITSTGGTVTVSSGSVSVYDFTTAAKALLQTEAEDALVTHRLDELLNADSDIDGAAPPTVGSVFHELMTKTTGSFTYDQTTDSLEAVRDRGDSAWTTATGFSTLDAAGVRTAVGLASANLDTQLSTIDTVVDTILVDTNELQTDWVNGGRLDVILDARASQTTLDVMYGSLVSATGAVTTGATATVIPTNMSPTANSYNDQLLVFTSGNLVGRAVPILSNTSGGVFTMVEAFHAAPSDGSTFNITPSHVHSVAQIQSGLATTANVAAVETDTQDIQSRLPAALVSGRMDSNVQATASALTFNLTGSISGSVGSVTGNVGGNVTGSVGSLATQAKADVNTEADAALADVGLTTTVTGRIDRAISAILTTAMTESYNADGSAPTPAQALFVIMQRLTEFSISGATITAKKLDGSTTAFTLTLDSATTPTSSTRAS